MGTLEPPGQARPDLNIFLDYARRMDLRDADGPPFQQSDEAESAFVSLAASTAPCARRRRDKTGSLRAFDHLTGVGISDRGRSSFVPGKRNLVVFWDCSTGPDHRPRDNVPLMSARERPRAAIIVTGSELLTGSIADRNGPWLAHELGELGFEVAHVLLVGDRPNDLDSALRFAVNSGCVLVVTSGGLGSTADDLTAEVVASFAGAELVLDEDMRKHIAGILRGWAARTEFSAPAIEEANRKQAMVPRGATALPPVGTAPGLVVPCPGGPLVVVLPGPPRELQGMWRAALESEPFAELLADAPAAEALSLRFFGLPESEIAATLRGLDSELDLSGVEVTTCLRRGELEVDLRPKPGAAVFANELHAALAARHAKHLVSTDGTTTDELLARALLERGWTVATGESCTSGMLASRLADRSGSSAYVAGGVVAYSNTAKTELLGVPAEMIEEHGAVSPEVARALADGARELFGAYVGVGITGVAGPDGGTEGKPIGYVCLCVTTVDGLVLARDPHLPGGRSDVREHSTNLGMHLLLRASAPRPAD